MAIETKYICDKCGHTQPERDQMWEVAITVRHLNFHNTAVAAIGKTGDKHKRLWCRKCVQKAHLLCADAGEKVKVSLKPPTLEDIVREIVQEEIEAGA